MKNNIKTGTNKVPRAKKIYSYWFTNNKLDLDLDGKGEWGQWPSCFPLIWRKSEETPEGGVIFNPSKKEQNSFILCSCDKHLLHYHYHEEYEGFACGFNSNIYEIPKEFKGSLEDIKNAYALKRQIIFREINRVQS